MRCLVSFAGKRALYPGFAALAGFDQNSSSLADRGQRLLRVQFTCRDDGARAVDWRQWRSNEGLAALIPTQFWRAIAKQVLVSGKRDSGSPLSLASSAGLIS